MRKMLILNEFYYIYICVKPPLISKEEFAMQFRLIRKASFFFFFLIIPLFASPLLLRSETVNPAANTSVPLSSLSVPEELGKVQERFSGKSARTVIQIQDVHAHLAAQQNIAAILERLRTVFGIKTSALEGAWTSTSLPKSQMIPTSREKQLLAGTLLEDDLISGPVYTAIMSPKPVLLVGIENDALYEKNRAIYLAHLSVDGRIKEQLRVQSENLENLQRSVWNPDLLNFGNAAGKFRDTADLGKFFPFLFSAAEANGAETSNLAQITLLKDTLALEKSFSKEKMEQEVKTLMREYKNTPWTLEELMRGGKIPAEKLGSYPEIQKLNRLYQMRDQISLQDLMAQIEVLIGQVLEKLFKTPEERSLWEKMERFYLTKRILLLQATPSDIQAYEAIKETLETDISEEFRLSLEFYDVVKKRDDIFFDKIMNDPALAGDIAVVTGGFHTSGLSQKFRDAGISYITITPELGDTAMNEKLYEKRMTEAEIPMEKSSETALSSADRAPTASTLSELRNALARIDEDFPPAVAILKKTKNVWKAKKRYLRYPVSVSPSQEISHLSREGRISPETKTGTSVNASRLRLDEFMAKPRAEQLAIFRLWLKTQHKSMLVSSVSVLTKMLETPGTEARLKALVARGDLLFLLQDVAADKTPVALLSRGIERIEASDLDAIQKTSPFLSYARHRPYVFMKNGYTRSNHVVVDEDSVWLELFPVITASASHYENARNAAFLALIKSLGTEVISQEVAGRAA